MNPKEFSIDNSYLSDNASYDATSQGWNHQEGRLYYGLAVTVTISIYFITCDCLLC